MTMRFLAVFALCLAGVASAPAAAVPAVAHSGPVDPDAAAAAGVARAYFAQIGQRRYAAARRLRWDDTSLPAFVRAFSAYRDYHGVVGRPGRVEGAMHSAYVEVPVRVHGRLRSGRRFSERGTMTLRRVNDLEGSTAAERRWRVYGVSVAPRF